MESGRFIRVTDPVNAVAYGNETYVAVSQGKVSYSEDKIVWRTFPVLQDLKFVTFALDSFYAADTTKIYRLGNAGEMEPVFTSMQPFVAAEGVRFLTETTVVTLEPSNIRVEAADAVELVRGSGGDYFTKRDDLLIYVEGSDDTETVFAELEGEDAEFVSAASHNGAVLSLRVNDGYAVVRETAGGWDFVVTDEPILTVYGQYVVSGSELYETVDFVSMRKVADMHEPNFFAVL